MIIFLIIFSTIVILSLLGMFYWMYKARKGELNLKKKSWHMRYMNYLWDVKSYEVNNVCPYYWSLILSLLITPIYFLVKWLYLGCKWLNSIEIPFINKIHTPKFISNIKLPIITKESVFKRLYKKSKIYLEYGFYIGVVISTLIALVIIFQHLFIKDLLAFKIIISMILIFALILIQTIKKPEWDKYFITPVAVFFKSLFNVIVIPFKILGAIFSYLGEVIFKVYKNNCSPINWI